MSWQNQNTSKKVFKFSRPLDQEKELMESIPSDAIITEIERNTKNIKVTYVIEKSFSIQHILESNAINVKPLKLDRVSSDLKNKTRKPTKQVKYLDDVVAVINVADFHLNRKVFGDAQYNISYDLEEASKLWMEIVDRSVAQLRSCPYHVEKIVLNTCGDLFNSDTINGTTSHGTIQTNDVSWKGVFTRATELMEYALRTLSNVAPVEYFYVRGNHDEQAGFYLTSWLDARFRNVENVEIRLNPKPRQIFEYGSNLLIFTHGESEGARTIDLPFVEPSVRDNGKAYTNIEVLSGHLHSNTVRQERGVRWEILNSACPIQSDWEYGKAFDTRFAEATIMFYNNKSRIQQNHIDTLDLLIDMQQKSKEGKVSC